MEIEKAAGIILDLSAWKVYSPDAGDILKAINIQQKFNFSFWDAMIIQAAISTGCQVIWSEDFNDDQMYEGVRVQNPFRG